MGGGSVASGVSYRRDVPDLRPLLSPRLCGEHAQEYVDVAAAASYRPAGPSEHAERTLAAELLGGRRLLVAAAAGVLAVVGGLLLGSGVGEPSYGALPRVVLAVAGLAVVGVAVGLALHVVRDGRRVKRAYGAWVRAGDRALGGVLHLGGVHTVVWSARGWGHVVLGVVLWFGALLGVAALVTGASAEGAALARAGTALALLPPVALLGLAAVAVSWTPWRMLAVRSAR